jgi:hypothetical protein
MISEDKTGLLKAFLGSLNGDIAARLASAIEADRLMDGRVLPHDAILESLRPALREQHAGRTPTPLRLFCRPFEDILTQAPRRTKQKASISRASVLPVWLWLSRDLIPDACKTYIDQTKALIVSRRYTEAARRAETFWNEAGKALTAGVATPAARTALNDAMIVEDAREMALLLSVGADMVRIQEVLPAPVQKLDEDLVWQLRAIYDDLVVRTPDAAPFVAVMAMNRLTHPWEALRLPMQICRQHNDTLISQTDMGLVGEILFQHMETLRDGILATRHPHFQPEILLEQVAQFTELSNGLVKEIDLKRGGEWGQRLLKERAQIGPVMDGFMERALKEISAAMPLQRGAGASADFSRASDNEKRDLALRYARLVTGSRNFAAAASFAAKQKVATEEIGAYLRRYIEDAVKELRGSDPARRAIVESQFQLCVDMTAVMFSDKEAELLQRRGRAASAA